MEPIRRIVRDKKTGLYFAGDNKWVANEADAMHFKSGLSAIDLCDRFEGKNVEVVMRFEPAHLDVRIDIC